MKKVLLALVLTLVIGAQPALAIERLDLGAGVGAIPDYEGSEDYEPVFLPFARADLDSGQYLHLLGNQVKANVLPDDIWSFGPMLQYIPERDDVDNNRVDDMKKVDTSIMLGVFGGVEIDRWNAGIEARQDVADGNGFLLTLNVGYGMPINDQLRLQFGAFTTYADGDYMNTYFSVDSGDASRSGLKEYDADSGFKDFGFTLNGRYNFYGNWSVMGIFHYTRLIGDAEDSPVVDDEGDANQFFGGVIFIYSF